MAVRAIRGATQVDADDREQVLEATRELVGAVLERNRLEHDDVISILFTATPDLVSEFPALAARELGMGDVPLMCAAEMTEGRRQRAARDLTGGDDVRRSEEIDASLPSRAHRFGVRDPRVPTAAPARRATASGSSPSACAAARWGRSPSGSVG